MQESKRFQILSLDGGGFKGLFSAAVLAHIEEDLGTKLVDHFDLIVGTSTGGIIALALGLGLSPREVVEVYLKLGPEVFGRTRWQRLLRLGRQLFFTKHPSGPFEEFLAEQFGQRRLGDSHKRLVIPSFDLDEADIYLFKTAHQKRFARDYKVPAWKVARATSAAPAYFQTCRAVDGARLIDGGMWANNPTLVGIIEAMKYLRIERKSISVLSVGTSYEVGAHGKRLDHAGLIPWAKPAVETMFAGQSRAALTHASFLIGGDNVCRIDPPVPKGLFDLDKHTNADALIGRASVHARKATPVFEERFLPHVAPVFIPEHSDKESE